MPGEGLARGVSARVALAAMVALASWSGAAAPPFSPVPDAFPEVAALGDAGDSRAEPTQAALVARNGGAFAGGDDADWFTLDASAVTAGPQCVLAEAASTTWASLTLVTLPAEGQGWTLANGVPGGDEGGIVLAAPSLDALLVGLAPRADPGTSAPPAPGAYAFDVTVTPRLDLGAGDAGTGADAPATRAAALPLAASCIGGTLGGSDAVDAYAFEATAGTQVVASFAATGTAWGLGLVDAAGEELVLVGSGDAATFTLPEDGAFYLVAAAPPGGTPVEYVLGLLGPDPPSHPCRPYCMSSPDPGTTKPS